VGKVSDKGSFEALDSTPIFFVSEPVTRPKEAILPQVYRRSKKD